MQVTLASIQAHLLVVFVFHLQHMLYITIIYTYYCTHEIKSNTYMKSLYTYENKHNILVDLMIVV